MVFVQIWARWELQQSMKKILPFEMKIAISRSFWIQLETIWDWVTGIQRNLKPYLWVRLQIRIESCWIILREYKYCLCCPIKDRSINVDKYKIELWYHGFYSTILTLLNYQVDVYNPMSYDIFSFYFFQISWRLCNDIKKPNPIR